MAHILVGDDTGLIKRVRLRDSAVTKFGSQAASRSVHSLAWAGLRDTSGQLARNEYDDSLESEVLVGLKSGIVELWSQGTAVNGNRATNAAPELLAQFNALSISTTMSNAVSAAAVPIHPSFRTPQLMNAGSKLVGMAVLQSSTTGSMNKPGYERRLLTCSNQGVVHIRPFSTLTKDPDELMKEEDAPAPTPAATAASKRKSSKKSPSLSPALAPSSSTATAASASASISRGGSSSFVVGSDLSILKVEPQAQGSFACGGKEHMLKIWDLETAQMTFKEKNVPHDMLNLRQEIWITDLVYVPNTGGHELVTGTAFHQVRHYDTRIQKRPLFNVEIGDHAVTCIDVSADGRYLVVGDGGGRLQQLDLRKNARMVHVYHGIGGSVRGIQAHASMPVLSACGLDRFLRVYDVNTRKQLHKVYLKQKLNSVLFSSQTPDQAKEREEKEAQIKEEENIDIPMEDEDDELWRELNTRAKRQATAASATSGTGVGQFVKKRKSTAATAEAENDDEESSESAHKKFKIKQEPISPVIVPVKAPITPAAAAASTTKSKIAAFKKISSAAIPQVIQTMDADESDEDAEEDENNNEGEDDDEPMDDGEEEDQEESKEEPEPEPEPEPVIVAATPARKTRASRAPATATAATPATTRSTRSRTKLA